MKTYIKIALALVACSGLNAANPKPALSPLTVGCVSSTPASITLSITAGATGAPAGFSVQWMKQADLDALGGVWPSDEAAFCKASFSGVPSCSSYNLAPNGSVNVVISDGLLDACGATNHCETPLDCGTEYAFRVFAHANRTYDRSAFSYGGPCSTASCGGGGGGCTYTQGYWKNHPEAWVIDAMTLGTVPYDQGDLLAIFGTPTGTNGLISLAHQLIATKLNIANGADPTAIQSSVSAADALIGGLVVPPLGTGYLAPATTSALVTALTDYNEGTTGPGHCP
jgi:hypothetical protein